MYTLNRTIKNTQWVHLNGTQYPVLIDGSGSIPCLSLGIGTLTQRTMSEYFKKLCTIYATDSYWLKDNPLADASKLTMQKFVDDTTILIAALKLEKPVILAHSGFGMAALELAKQKKDLLRGIIMIAATPCWNTQMIEQTNALFDKVASSDRKANDLKRKEHFAKIRKPRESELSLNTYESCSARYWGNYNVSREFLEKLWAGIEPDDAICDQFWGVVLPSYNLAKDIDKVSIPVILLAGHLDFDSMPLELWKTYPKPPNFTIVDCGQVGHWPQLESPELFDDGIDKWVRKEKL